MEPVSATDEFIDLARQKWIGIFVIAYNATREFVTTLERIPESVRDVVTEIYLIDDASPDNTFLAAAEYARRTGFSALTVLRNPANMRYGGNQRVGYEYAIKKGFDYVVMLHADGQYAPEFLSAILMPLLREEADVVMGSRMTAKGDALKGGMPRYKYFGNIILSTTQRKLSGLYLSEFHSGYRAYRVQSLAGLQLNKNTHQWHFDTQILYQMHEAGHRIVEIPIPTYYGNEICRVNGIVYGLNILVETACYWLHRKRLILTDRYKPKADMIDYQSKLLDPYSTHSEFSRRYRQLPRGSRVLEISAPTTEVLEVIGDCPCQVDVIEPSRRGGKLPGNVAMSPVTVEKYLEEKNRPTYDRIFLGDVIEHVEDPEGVLDCLASQLALKGKIVASVPNVAHWSVRLSILFGRFSYSDHGIMDVTHRWFFTKRSYLALLHRAGLRVLRLEAIPAPIPLVIPLAAKGRVLSWIQTLQKWAAKLWPGLFAYQLLVECVPITAGYRFDRPAGEPRLKAREERAAQ